MPTVRAIFCSLLATLSFTTASHAARHALVIGNDNYATVAKLRNARSDATAMAEALKMAGYQVLLQTDRTQREMLDDVLALQHRVQGGDEVVLFFSGHGVQIGAMNYLLPIDVRSATEAQVKNDAIALNKLLDDVREKRPALTLAIIDACRDNPFKGNGRDIGGRGLTGVAGVSGQMVIYAAGEGQQALDRLGSGDQAKNGLFTRVFVKEMTKPDVQVRDVLYNVREEVVRLARSVNHEQVPAIYDQVVGRFYFRQSVPSGQTGQRESQPTARPATSALQPGQVFRDCQQAYCPEMVVIAAGQFTMGSNDYDDEKPPHNVSIQSFAMGKFEVTQGQWKAVMGENPSRFKDCGDSCPVEKVSWDDIQQFLQKLNRLTGKRYRLPSEAEWEYAAKAGRTGKWSFGDNESELAEHARFTGNSLGKTWPVGQKKGNAFGLHDMHGNVWEWVQDVWQDNYLGAPTDGSAWMSLGDQSRRVLRGGSWLNNPPNLRSSVRGRTSPVNREDYVGFRVAQTLSP